MEYYTDILQIQELKWKDFGSPLQMIILISCTRYQNDVVPKIKPT